MKKFSQCSVWGSSINFFKDGEMRVYGHYTPRPEIGDLYTHPMKSGRTGVFKFIDIEYMRDPEDMFFANVEPIGYDDEPENIELLKQAEDMSKKRMFSYLR